MKKHYMSNTKMYHSWRNMKRRCDNPDAFHEKYYENITYCDDWKNFRNFYIWAINNNYVEGYTLERIDITKGYCPENCKWIPAKDQAKNKRNTTHLVLYGIDLSYTEWEKIYGIRETTIRARIKYNYPKIKLIDPINYFESTEYNIWHKELITVLPKSILIKTWIFCCYIIKHCLNSSRKYMNNKIKMIKQYSIDHFYTYVFIILYPELIKRKININSNYFNELKNVFLNIHTDDFEFISKKKLFDCWHTTRYLLQDLMILERMYDFGEITFDEWFKILNKTRSMHVYCEETYQSLFV